MGLQRTSRWCGYCGERVLAERAGTSHVLHLLLSVLTCGLWLVVWLGTAIKFGGWRCSRCGSRV